MEEAEVPLVTRRQLPFGELLDRLHFQLPAPLPFPLVVVEVVSSPSSVLVCAGGKGFSGKRSVPRTAAGSGLLQR